MTSTVSVSDAWARACALASQWIERTGASPRLRRPLTASITRMILRGEAPTTDRIHDLATALREELECA